jgi:hypothetical protein
MRNPAYKNGGGGGGEIKKNVCKSPKIKRNLPNPKKK